MSLLNKLISKLFTGKKTKKIEEFDKKLVFKLSKKGLPKPKQVKYIFSVLTKKERLIISLLLGLIVASSLFLGIRSYFTHSKVYPKEGGNYTEGLIGQPTFINPVLCFNEVDKDISSLIFPGLLKYDSKNNLSTEIAQSYQISSDKKTYIFKLKKDIHWTDGERLTSQDIIFTINLIKNEKIHSPLYSIFKDIKVEAIDDYTIKFTLSKPYTPFSSLLTFGFLPKHIWEKIPLEKFSTSKYNLQPIGYGPFEFQSLVKGENGKIKIYSLKKNKKYFRQPLLDNITFKFFSTPEEAFWSLRNKNIDGFVYHYHDWPEEIENSKSIKKHIFYLSQYIAIFLNQNDSLLKNFPIRQALSLAINKNELNQKLLNGNGKIINGPFPIKNFDNESGIGNFDLNKANSILEKEGWRKNNQNIREKNKKHLKITLTTIEEGDYPKVAEYIKKSWEKIGIETKIELIPSQEIFKKIIQEKNYQALLYGIITGYDVDPYPVWHSSQIKDSGLNFSFFSSRKADKLLSEARITLNNEEREKRYKEFQKILEERIPAIFLYSPPYYYFLNEKVRGIDFKQIALPSDRFVYINKWSVRIKRKIK